jgi:hypothetical protein
MVREINRGGMTEDELKQAHKHSFKNRSGIQRSTECGCFYCGKKFAPEAITDWIDDGQTALCPNCGIDSVLGSSSGFPISKELLDEMCDHWF